MGVSKLADEFCGLCKAGVLRALSVGFDPIEYKPNKAGGYDYDRWELLELSVVAVPANPGATVFARSHGMKASAVLALIERAHRHLGSAHRDIGEVLKAAGRLPPADDSDPEDADQELSPEAIDLGAIPAKSGGTISPQQLRGGPHLTAWLREKEAARRWAFFNRALP